MPNETVRTTSRGRREFFDTPPRRGTIQEQAWSLESARRARAALQSATAPLGQSNRDSAVNPTYPLKIVDANRRLHSYGTATYNDPGPAVAVTGDDSPA